MEEPVWRYVCHPSTDIPLPEGWCVPTLGIAIGGGGGVDQSSSSSLPPDVASFISEYTSIVRRMLGLGNSLVGTTTPVAALAVDKLFRPLEMPDMVVSK